VLVRVTVAVGFAVRLVAPVHIGDEVPQRETVVRDDVVDRVGRVALRPPEHIARCAEAQRELAAGDVLAQPPAPHAVTEAVVPFGPPRREGAELVAVGADVPGLGDEPHPGEQRILRDGAEQRGLRRITVVAARERGGEIEAEAVDAHVGHPVAQAVHHELQHPWPAQVEHVAAARFVAVPVRPLPVEPVPRRVVEPAPGERRTMLVALAGMVEHHIDDHLDACGVQRPHHRAELLAHRPAVAPPRGVARLGTEEAEGVVAPIVAQPAGLQRALVHVLMHRQQAHRRHAEALQMSDGGGMRESGVGAAQRGRDVRMALREPFDVQLVEHEVLAGTRRPTMADPAGLLVHHTRERRRGRHDLPRPGIEQHLARIEAVAERGLPRTVRTEPVDQPRHGAREMAMPDIAAATGQIDALQLALPRVVEDAELDALRVRREHGEVDAGAVPTRTEGRGTAHLQRCRRRRHGRHARNTVASGGKVSATLWPRPCDGTGSLRASPKGVP